MKKSHKLLDFTPIETIYETELRTIRLKIAPVYVASPTAKTKRQTATGPQAVYNILQTIFAMFDDSQEHLVLLVLNPLQDVTGYKLISSGGQDRAIIDGKVLFRNALLLGASSIILAHNHPSGQLEPSEEDLLVTMKMVAAGRTLDIEVVDHIIYTPNGYRSIRELAPSIFALEPTPEE